MFFRKKENPKDKLIPVLPKNYRRIALYAIENIESPTVLMDKKKIFDYSDQGDLTQKGIRKCINFEILNGKESVLGFHDNPNEMWVSENYSFIAEHCSEEGWLKIEGPAS